MLTGTAPKRWRAVTAFALAAMAGTAGLAGARRQGAADEPPKISPLETRILGERSWLRGGPASLRVIVTNHNTGRPEPAAVTITAQPANGNGQANAKASLFTGKTNASGTLDASFRAPSGDPGAYRLDVHVKSPAGEETATEQIQLQEATRILLTTDKPIYQPGQVIHLRALAIDQGTRQAVSGAPVTFEVEDARGNKVFKKKDTLSRYGVSSADFVLADEVNMGAFKLRAILPTGDVEKTVRVERYVLPKFKVSVTTDKPYYLPGEEVRGTVKAAYFFGKPVNDGKVSIDVNTFDVGVTKLGEIKGDTNPIGVYTFRYQLPKSFVGQPFEQGKAVVEFHTTLKDTADHKQEMSLSVPVVKDPIVMTVVPESRRIAPGLENRVYIAAATPDGAPLKGAKIEVSREVAAGRPPATTTVTTDSLGIAVYAFNAPAIPEQQNATQPAVIRGGRPMRGGLVRGGFAGGAVMRGGFAGGDVVEPASDVPDGPPVKLTIRATDAQGRSVASSQSIGTAGTNDSILLRSDKTLAKVGERLNLTALSSIKSGTVYVDVIRNKQTILTAAQPLNRGEAHLSLPLSPDMNGSLEIRAYKVLPSEDIVRDSRTIVVSPADDLNIRITSDRAEYRPGGDAALNFAVTDRNGQGIAAALGLAIVDESVFALSELQPGLEKIYFMLEKELMEPKYEIHGLRPTGLILPNPVPLRDAERQRAAAVIFAAAPAAPDFDIRVNTWQVRWQQVRQSVVEKMQKRCQTISNAIQKFRTDTGSPLTAEQSLTELVRRGYLREADLLDSWGHPYVANLYGAKTYDNYFDLSSAGPDGKMGTPDDIAGVTMYGLRSNFRGRMLFGMQAGRAGMKADQFAANGAFGGGAVFDRAAAPMRDGMDVRRELAAAPMALADDTKMVTTQVSATKVMP